MKETPFLHLSIVEWVDNFTPLVPMNNNANILDTAIQNLTTASEKYASDIENLNTAVNEHNAVIESNSHAITDLQTTQNVQDGQIGTLNTNLDAVTDNVNEVSAYVGAWVNVGNFQTITDMLGNHVLEKDISESITDIYAKIAANFMQSTFAITISGTGSGTATYEAKTQYLIADSVFMFSGTVTVASATAFTLNVNVGELREVLNIFNISVSNNTDYRKDLYSPTITADNHFLSVTADGLTDGQYFVQGVLFVGKVG